MGLDWGLLGSLRGRDNWAEIKQEKANELQYQGVLNRMQEDENASNQQKQAAIQGYLQTAYKLKVLPNGMERIKAINEPLQATIAENIKKYGGDLDKYWKVQGQVDMQNYLQQLLHHPTTTRELMNASAAARWQADKQAGRQEKGQIDLATGEIVNPFENQLHEYQAGNIDALNYSGAFDRQDFDPKVFSQFYGDPKDPYKVVPVGVQTFRDYAYNDFKGKGMEDDVAQQQADQMTAQYAKAMKQPGFQPYTFKHDQRPRPQAYSAAFGNDQNALISARFTVDQLDAVSNPAYDKWVRPKQVYVDVVDQNGNHLRKDKVVQKEADMAPIPIGKKSVTVKEQSVDSNGKALVKKVVKEVDDYIEPILKIGGKRYIQTTANRLEGKQPVPLESKAINRIILATPKTPDGLRMIAAYSKVLAEKGVLTKEGLADFEMNNQPQPQGSYVDAAGTEVDLEGSTEEQIQQAIDAGIIKPRE